MEKKRKIGFSLIEVVISISIIALILSTLGISFLASQRLKLNAQIRSDVQRCGETILDYLFTLPPTDQYIYNINQNNNNQNNNQNNPNILSIYDLSRIGQGSQDVQNIIYAMNAVLANFAQANGFDVLNNPKDHIHSKKGAILRFNNANGANQSRVTFDINGNIMTVTLGLYYVWGPQNRRRGRIINVSRVNIL
ncbi:MAG: prepilin-type N-terminal cleavage/methylation domain-containing protein [bacterium]